jgi:putative alpha-1,2-mannosidase
LFDPATGFLRGKHADGSWLEPFDEVQWGNPYVEGAAWQHRWDVPHDMDGLFAAMGGKDKAVAALEKMLTMDRCSMWACMGRRFTRCRRWRR